MIFNFCYIANYIAKVTLLSSNQMLLSLHFAVFNGGPERTWCKYILSRYSYLASRYSNLLSNGRAMVVR